MEVPTPAGRVRVVLAGCLLYSLIPIAAPAQTNYPILVQSVMEGMVTENGKKVPGYVGVGMGPFSTMFAAAGGVPLDDSDLGGDKFVYSMFGEWDMKTNMLKPISISSLGSNGLKNGSVFVNSSLDPGNKNMPITVSDIEITAANKKDTFTGSMGSTLNGNPDWSATTGTNAAGFPTMTIKANQNGTANGQFLWLSVPTAPPGALTGVLTPTPASAMQCNAPPAPPKKETPSTGNDGGSAKITYDNATGALTFNPGTLNIAKYIDGSTATSGDPILGSTVSIAPTTLTGPDSMVPNAFDVADTTLTVASGNNTYVYATLSHLMVYPNTDSSVPGSDSVLVGDLDWSTIPFGTSSRYLSEDWAFSGHDEIFLQTNLLGATNSFTADGMGLGNMDIGSVSSIPEFQTPWLLATGAFATVGRARRLRKRLSEPSLTIDNDKS